MSGLVVKDNALIQASYTLDLSEQRLILLAIIEARNSQLGITHDTLLRVHASSYAKHFKVNDKTAYTMLKDASKGLFDRYVTYHDKNPKNGRDRSFNCRWVDKVGIEPDSGIVYMRFTSDVVPLITRLEKQYTSYDIAEVANLTSSYAIRLYELIIQWRDKGFTQKYNIDELRSKLGVEPEQYKKMSNFKARVVDYAVNQINEHTDITVKYAQHKTGKSITAISFSFKIKQVIEHVTTASNKVRDTNTPDLFHNLTENQINLFSSRLAALPELGSNAPIGKSTAEFAAIIASELADESKQGKYLPYLSKVGYRHSKQLSLKMD